MLDMSFKLPDVGGYRYALAYRCRHEVGWGWRLERWDGEDWEYIGGYRTYAEVRRYATLGS